MAFLNLDLDYFDHPKTKRLIGLLGRGAAEFPIRLWCYCGKYHAKDGVLKGYSVGEIESIAGWTGEHGEMVLAFEKVGFMRKETDLWKINDWLEINGHLVVFKERAKKAAKQRWLNYQCKNDNAKAMPKHKSSNARVMLDECSLPNLTLPNLPNQKDLPPIIPLPHDLENNRAEIEQWLAYKREKKEGYKPQGLNALWTRVRKIPANIRKEAIEHSMAANYAGIFEPKGVSHGNQSVGGVKAEPGKYDGIDDVRDYKNRTAQQVRQE